MHHIKLIQQGVCNSIVCTMGTVSKSKKYAHVISVGNKTYIIFHIRNAIYIKLKQKRLKYTTLRRTCCLWSEPRSHLFISTDWQWSKLCLTLRPDAADDRSWWDNQIALNAQVTRSSPHMVHSAMMERMHTLDNHHDVALLTLFDSFHRLVV